MAGRAHYMHHQRYLNGGLKVFKFFLVLIQFLGY